MTKLEYVNKFAQDATSMVGTPVFMAMLDTAREENPFLAMGQHELAVLQLSGAAIGWQQCLAWLKSAHLPPKPKPERPTTGHYQDPENINQENKKP